MVSPLSRNFAFLIMTGFTFLRELRDRCDRNENLLRKPWGFSHADHRAIAMSTGSTAPAEVNLLRNLLPQVDQLIKVGFHLACFCCHAPSLAKLGIAIEPIARNFYFLQHNLEVNCWLDHVEVSRLASGASPSMPPMWCSDIGVFLLLGWASLLSENLTKVLVLPHDRIDGNALPGCCPYLLIDTESIENAVLSGPPRLLYNALRPL